MKKMLGAISTLALLMLLGCGGGSSPNIQSSPSIEPTKPAPATTQEPTTHTHVAAHGGIVNSVADMHVELVLDTATSKVTAYIFGEDGTTKKPIDAQSIPAEAKPEGSGTFVSLSLMAMPQKEEKPGAVSRFEAPAGDLAKVNAFELLLRIPINGKIYRTSFQIEPGRQVSGKSYICPMKHDVNKIYAQSGKCEICKMDLVEIKDGKIEHSDHTPKHGGIFFMASDKWHHLEGILASPTEFRVYFYDNFTKPISAKPYEATVEVVREDDKGQEVGRATTLSMKASKEGAYLVAAIPQDYSLPLYFTVRVKLREGERPALFNFTFDKVTDQPKEKKDERASN